MVGSPTHEQNAKQPIEGGRYLRLAFHQLKSDAISYYPTRSKTNRARSESKQWVNARQLLKMKIALIE